MVVTLGQQYNVEEKATVILYTNINRHAGTPRKTLTNKKATTIPLKLMYCTLCRGYITLILRVTSNLPKDDISSKWIQAHAPCSRNKVGRTTPFPLPRQRSVREKGSVSCGERSLLLRSKRAAWPSTPRYPSTPGTYPSVHGGTAR